MISRRGLASRISWIGLPRCQGALSQSNKMGTSGMASSICWRYSAVVAEFIAFVCMAISAPVRRLSVPKKWVLCRPASTRITGVWPIGAQARSVVACRYRLASSSARMTVCGASWRMSISFFRSLLRTAPRSFPTESGRPALCADS